MRKRNPSPTPSAVSSTSSGLSEKKVTTHGSATSLHPPKFGELSHYANENHDKSHPKAFKLGAASPQAVKKLLALSETSKTRPKTMPSTPSPLSKGHGGTHHHAHQHHHSLTNSVDLTAESSSVTSLPSTRKTQTNNSGTYKSYY